MAWVPDIDVDKLSTNPFIAAACGTAFGLKFFPGETWLERAWNGFIMFSGGVIIGGGIVDMQQIRGGGSIALIVLLSSALSMVVLNAVVGGVRATEWGKVAEDWVRKLLRVEKP